MKGKFMKKLLALSLSAVLLFGNVTPIYATEETTTETAKADAPTVTMRNEDGVVEHVEITNNDETEGNIYCKLSTEEEIEAGIKGGAGYWVSGLDTTLVSLVDVIIYSGNLEPGEYYFTAYTENYDEEDSELVVIEDYPFTVTETSSEETLIYQIGDLTGYGYFTGKSANDYNFAQLNYQYSWDESWEESYTDTNLLETSKEMFYINMEQMSDGGCYWAIEEVVFTKVDATDTGCTINKTSYISVEEGDAYQEPQADAPTLALCRENDVVTGIAITNNDDTYSGIWHGLVSKEEIENGVSLNHGVHLEGQGTYIKTIKEIFENDNLEAGEYYFAAYTVNDDEEASEVIVLENYPITITETSSEEAANYQTGSVTGYQYFTENPSTEYDFTEISIHIEDEWGGWSTEFNLSTKYGFFYLNTEDYENNYESWSIEKLNFVKLDATDTGCTAEKTVYTSFAENGTYEEPRADAPSLELVRENGVLTGIEITNNDVSDGNVCFDLLTKEEIEAGTELDGVYWLASANSRVRSFKRIVEDAATEPGEYYFVAYADCGEKTRSEMVVLEDYPFTITENSIDETLIYQTGDMTGYAYFTGMLADEYAYGKITVRITDEANDNSWNTTNDLYTKSGIFYFADTWLVDDNEEYSVEEVVFGKIDATDKGCNVTQNIYTSAEAGELFDEPKAPAPTVELYRDADGNVLGVKITNNITHDKGEIDFGYYAESGNQWTEWEDVEAGETRIVLFEELNVPEIAYSGENITFKCRAYDWENGLYSQYVILDYAITGVIEEYTGENIIVQKENNGNYDWYYVGTEQLSENTCSLVLNADGGNFEFTKSDDDTQWIKEMWYETVVDGLTSYSVAPEASGMTITSTQIPQEKITVETRDYSSKEVLILDYDHYNAFIASGGSITVNQNAEVEVSTDNFISDVKWTLEYLYQQFENFEIYTFVKNIAAGIKELANKYWKSEAGSFAEVNYYDTEGNIIAEDSISEHDVVLIEYAPEIVWVNSMELTAPAKMEQNETAAVSASLDAGQDKYPFNRTPQIRYESSNPEVVAVDAETGALTAGTVDGVATITAYADEELRAQEGLDEIVTASVEITVGEEVIVEKDPVTEVFGDVSEDSWYVDAVQYVYDNDIMSGSGGVFTPNTDVTRAMVVETLYKMEGRPEVTDFTLYDQFTDLSRDAWWANSIAWAMNENIATGDSYYKLFNPETPVTREQLATFFWRYAKYKEIDVSLSQDASEIIGDAFVNSYALEGFAWSVDSGLISGTQSTDAAGNIVYDLAPQLGATRAQLAVILQRFCETYDL